MMQYPLDSRLIEEVTHEHHLLVLNTKKNAEMREHYCVLCCQIPQFTFTKTMAMEGSIHKKLMITRLKKNPCQSSLIPNTTTQNICLFKCFHISIFKYNTNMWHWYYFLIVSSDQDFKPLMHVNPLVKRSTNCKKKIHKHVVLIFTKPKTINCLQKKAKKLEIVYINNAKKSNTCFLPMY
jgi:hypothetical protein